MAGKSPKRKSLQSYLDEVRAQTGKSVAEFRELAAQKGITKTSQLVEWLSTEYGLGYHHAGALNVMLFHPEKATAGPDEQIADHFAGSKARWREPYETLIAAVTGFGDDVEVVPNMTYINLNRQGKKFAFVQTAATRLEIGLKRKDVAPTARFAAAGSWNTMVTHRVRISDPQAIDAELLGWLQQAYVAA